MKTFRCSCSDTRIVEDNIIMVICKRCQKSMVQVNSDAQEFRKKKVTEVFSKENPTEIELEIVNRWVEMFKGDIYDTD